MDGDMIRRRDRALARHDSALERWPDRGGAGFAAELQAVGEELHAVAEALDARGVGALERCRSWRYAGDALFDLARGTDAAILKRAAAAYDRAEKVLAGIDAPLDRAKLDFNFGNILRGLSGGQGRALLEEALLRYQLALGVFLRLSPQHARTVQAALDTLTPQLKLPDTLDRVRAGHASATAAAQALEQAPDDAAARERARQVLEQLKERRGALLADAMAAVQDFGRRQATGQPMGQPTGQAIGQPMPPPDPVGALIGQLQSAAGTGDDPFQRLFPMLLARFQSEIDGGRIPAARRAALEPILRELQALINQPEGGLDASVDRMGQLRQLMTRMTALLAEPSTGQAAPPAGSRAEALMRIAGAFAQRLSSDQLAANLGPAERRVATELFTDLAQARTALPAGAGDAARTRAHERDVLRPLAQRMAQFALRHHLTVATPFWALGREPPDPSGVYACGAAGTGTLLDTLAQALALKRIRPATVGDAGQARWNAIVASQFVLCDLRLPAGPEFAAACYEIGLAKALGRPLAVVVDAATSLPFDIDTAPIELSGGAGDRDTLAAAIDAALYTPRHGEADSSLAETIAELARRYGSSSSFQVCKSLELVQQAANDPIEAQHRIESLLGFVGAEAPRLLHPAWPGGYPSGERRLFHVMPFSLGWSGAARDAAAAGCRKQGVRYVRGDEVPDARVIHSIWDEICRASHVLVDLSAFNANVALELGLVHGLGRHALIVGQGDTVKRLFPAIRKVRVLPYGLAEGGATLREAVERFVATPGPAG